MRHTVLGAFPAVRGFIIRPAQGVALLRPAPAEPYAGGNPQATDQPGPLPPHEHGRPRLGAFLSCECHIRRSYDILDIMRSVTEPLLMRSTR